MQNFIIRKHFFYAEHSDRKSKDRAKIKDQCRLDGNFKQMATKHNPADLLFEGCSLAGSGGSWTSGATKLASSDLTG